MANNNQPNYHLRQRIGLFLGIIIFILMLLLPAPGTLGTAGWHAAAVALLMGTWWITEAIPIAATALIPLVLFPILGVNSIDDAARPYANPLIFLFMGGFMIAIAMQTWNLHRRIALNIIKFIGVKPSSVIIGFIIASGFLSMWVSNTATAMMMLPIGLSIIELLENRKSQQDSLEKLNFEIVLVLSIAYASNIGGMGTLIGTPPNALLAGFMHENYQVEIGFAEWMEVGLPLVIVALPLMYLLLTKLIYPIKITELPGGKEIIDREMSELGEFSKPEKIVAIVFFLTALFWIGRPLLSKVIPGLSDAGIAMAAALLLFLIPVDFNSGRFVLSWADVKKLPWGVLILFGGGLSLASAISDSGLAKWIGSGVAGLSDWPILVMILIVVTLIVFLTEMTSNTATTAAFLPIMASAAIGIGQNPLLFIVPAALSASCAFMLPVATPPNAIVYGSGRVTIPEMSKAGLWLNMTFIILITLAAYTLISYSFGIQIGQVPGWVY